LILTKDLYSAKEVQEIFGVTKLTLSNWRKSGKLSCIKLNQRNFKYRKEDIENLLGIKQEKQNRMNVIYCRVSCAKQKDDLKKQEQLLKDFCNTNGYVIDKCFSEIASGMNENREQFNKLIDLVIENKVENIFISFKDRLTRFGFDYFKNLFERFDCKIIVLNNLVNEENFQKELTEDLIAIIHHFSMKMYSNRRKQLKEVQKILEKGT